MSKSEVFVTGSRDRGARLRVWQTFLNANSNLWFRIGLLESSKRRICVDWAASPFPSEEPEERN